MTSRTKKIKGNLPKIKQPRFLSLVKYGSNMSSWKILRGDAVEELPEPQELTIPEILAIKRHDEVLALTFAEDDAEFIDEIVNAYGMDETPFIKEENPDGSITLRFQEETDDAVVIQVRKDLAVQVKRAETAEALDSTSQEIEHVVNDDEEVMTDLSICSIEFSKSTFPDFDIVQQYLENNDISYKDIADKGDFFVAIRNDSPVLVQRSLHDNTIRVNAGAQLDKETIDAINEFIDVQLTSLPIVRSDQTKECDTMADKDITKDESTETIVENAQEAKRSDASDGEATVESSESKASEQFVTRADFDSALASFKNEILTGISDVLGKESQEAKPAEEEVKREDAKEAESDIASMLKAIAEKLESVPSKEELTAISKRMDDMKEEIDSTTYVRDDSTDRVTKKGDSLKEIFGSLSAFQ